MRDMFVDLETTGFSPEKNNIIELALRCEGKNFSTYLNPKNINWGKGTLEFHQKNIPDILERIKNGMNEEQLEKMLCLYLKSLGISSFSKMNEIRLIAHNGNMFDFKFIKRSKILSKYFLLENCNTFDTLEYLKKSDLGKNLGKGRSLSETAEKLEVKVKEADLHSADYDTELLEEVFEELKRRDANIGNTEG